MSAHNIQSQLTEGKTTRKIIDGGPTVPADGQPGYEQGCLFVHTDATEADEDAMYWSNQGTSASCNFDAINITLV